MQFRYQLSLWEQYQMTLAIAFRPSPLYLVHALGPAMGALLLYQAFDRDEALGVGRFFASLLAFFFTPILFGMMVAVGWFQMRKSSREILVEFTDEGVSVENAHAKSLIKWNAITEIRETKSYFFFHLKRQQAAVVPRRVISPSQFIELRQFIRKSVGIPVKLLED